MPLSADDLTTLLRAPRWATVINWGLWLGLATPVVVLAGCDMLRRRRLRPIGVAAALLLALTVIGVAAGVRARLIEAGCWHHARADAVCARMPPEGVKGLYDRQWWD